MSNVDFEAGIKSPGLAQTAKIPGGHGHHIRPRFFSEQVKLAEMDPETALPRFRTVEYVELLIAGDKGNAPTKRVTPDIIAQFPNEYAMWKSKAVNADMIGDGIPLTLWPTCRPDVAKGLEFINVFTVQQLAGLPDTAISKPGQIGLRELREKARAFVESAKTTAPIAKLEAENLELKSRLTLQQTQIQQLLDTSAEMQKQLNDAGLATQQQQTVTRTTRKGKEEN